MYLFGPPSYPLCFMFGKFFIEKCVEAINLWVTWSLRGKNLAVKLIVMWQMNECIQIYCIYYVTNKNINFLFFFFFTFLKSSRLTFVVKPCSPVCLTFNLNTFKQQPLGRCYFANVDLVIHFLKKTNFPFFASLTCH